MRNCLVASLLALLLLAACGGGGGDSPSTTVPAGSNVNYNVFVVDDYVLGGTATVTELTTSSVVSTGITGPYGEISIDLPGGRSFAVSVSGGVIDADGDPTTTNDQTPFTGAVRGLLVPNLAGYKQVLGAASTGAALFAGNDPAKYESALRSIGEVLPTLIGDGAAGAVGLGHALSVQRSVGYDSIVSELSDDGQFNDSKGVPLVAIDNAVASQVKAQGMNIADAQLFACIERAAGKENPTVSEIQAVSELVCASRYVYSLEGIQALVNLKSLVLRDNAITSVAPLTALSKLEYLDLAENRIGSVAAIARSYGEQAIINVEDNCLAGSPTLTTGQWLFAGVQRATCGKVVRDPVLFNAYRRDDAKFTIVYRIGTANSCTMDYSDAMVKSLQCDNAVHRLDVDAVYPGAQEYVRLRLDAGTYAVYPISRRIDALSASAALFGQGGFGNLEGYNGACPENANDCSVYADVHLTLGANGLWHGEVWRSSAGAPFVKQPAQAAAVWLPTSAGWVADGDSGAYAVQPDGSVLVTGADFGPAGAIGSARVQDLEGRLTAEVGETGAAATARFPAGAQAYWWTFNFSADRYQLYDSIVLAQRIAGGNGQPTQTPATLAAFVDAVQTPAAGQAVGNSQRWNGVQFTFDGVLASEGPVSFWSPTSGAIFVDKGRYQLRIVNGQQVLVVTQIPNAVLTDAATREPGVLAEYANRTRPFFGVVNGAVYQGTTTSAGTVAFARPALNKVALNTVLAARGYCQLPDANGNSICPPFSVSTVTPATFMVGQVSTITVTGVSVPSTAVLALADAECGAPYGHAANGFKQDCTPRAAGSKTLIVKDQSGGTAVYSTSVNVDAGAFSVSAVTRAALALNQPSTITVTGVNVPATAVLAVADAVCGVSFGHTATGFFQTCTPQLAGIKTLTVKDQPGGTVVYTTTVTVP